MTSISPSTSAADACAPYAATYPFLIKMADFTELILILTWPIFPIAIFINTITALVFSTQKGIHPSLKYILQVFRTLLLYVLTF